MGQQKTHEDPHREMLNPALREKQPHAPVQALDQVVRKQLYKEVFGVLMGKLTMRQHCTFLANVNSILDCIKKNITSRYRKVNLPLYSALVKHIWNTG